MTGPQQNALASLAVYAEQHPACFTATERENIIATARMVQSRLSLDDVMPAVTTIENSG